MRDTLPIPFFHDEGQIQAKSWPEVVLLPFMEDKVERLKCSMKAVELRHGFRGRLLPCKSYHHDFNSEPALRAPTRDSG